MELRINEARKKNNKQSRKNSSASNSNIIKELDSSGDDRNKKNEDEEYKDSENDSSRKEEIKDRSITRKSARASKRKINYKENENHHMAHLLSNDDGDKYRHVYCKDYENEKKQPIKVYLSFQAQFLMNVHAHLFEDEIIGFVSGYVVEKREQEGKGSSESLMFVHDCLP